MVREGTALSSRAWTSDWEHVRACAKRPTDIWTEYVYYPFSLRLVYAIRRCSAITPNVLTLAALALALAGAGVWLVGTRPALTAGLVLVQVSYVLDCADGQLARYRQQFSPIGGWLDQVADRVKEFALYFCLAWGYTRGHPDAVGLWKWTVCAVFVLYMLEYLGQIAMFRERGRAPVRLLNETGVPVEVEPAASQATVADTFTRLRRWRALIPFRGFIIGEQYFTLLVFLAFGAVYSLVVFVTLLGTLMLVYRPLVEAVKFLRRRQAGARLSNKPTAQAAEAEVDTCSSNPCAKPNSQEG
ncbi:MAG: CDP-alcohol phosphatidyltransferase family protein [Alicyclobacillus sp.]|nr:CDP-alcohol phosphatidyltransferase family protein [Alicyclobacillus sp.]